MHIAQLGNYPSTQFLGLHSSRLPCQLSYRGIYAKNPNVNSDSQFRQLSIFPGSLPPSIVDVKELNFRVRDGYGWGLFAIATEFRVIPSKLNNASSFSMTDSLSFILTFRLTFGQALGLLVSFSLMHYCTYTFDLSTM